jgi:hypothetical protein
MGSGPFDSISQEVLMAFILPLPRPRLLSGAALVVALGAAHAHGPAAPATITDPLDAQAAVPDVNYRSALEAYRSLGDDQPVSWIKANETVNRIGGWRTYAREALQAGPDTPAVQSAPGVRPPDRSGAQAGPHSH